MTSQRTTQTLRDMMFDQLDGLIEGKITCQQAKAASGLASQIISLSKLELEAARFISGSTEEIKKIGM
jgi:hypothetical protein